MLETSAFGTDGFSERDLFLLELAGFDDLPQRLTLPSRYFACLVACDAQAAAPQRILPFCSALLRSGAVYVCTWGPGCDRLQDFFDVASLADDSHPGESEPVMTTCHADESLDDALWYLINLTSPTPAYAPSCGATLAISIGEPDWSERMRAALGNPPGLDERVIGAERIRVDPKRVRRGSFSRWWSRKREIA